MRETQAPPFLWMGRLTTINEFITCRVFDQTVTRYGAWVEEKAMERDDKGKHKHTLDSLLYQSDQKDGAPRQRPPRGHTGIEVIEVEDGDLEYAERNPSS